MAFRYWGGSGRDQLFLLPTSMRDWLDEGHLAWFVIDVVAAIDTSGFHARYRTDGPGRPPYDPEMMLGLLFYAYGMGMRSSRRIEAACRTDAAFRVICGGHTPDHATIARFLVDHQEAIEGCFVDVLRLCAAAGLVSVGSIAIDGTKIGSDAALDANRGRRAISAELELLRAKAAEMVAEAKAADQADDRGVGFGTDRLDDEWANDNSRRARLERALAVIEAEDEALRKQADSQSDTARTAGHDGRLLYGRKPTDPHAAAAQAEVEVEVIGARNQRQAAERQARRAQRLAAAAARGGKPHGALPQSGPTRREQRELEAATARAATARAVAQRTPIRSDREVNITDPDSRIMKTSGGWQQGYNAQIAVNANQIVVACTVSTNANDTVLYQPMVQAATDTLAAVGIIEPIGMVLADAGYWSERNATVPGPDRLIATLKDWKQRQAARQLGATTGPPPPHATTLEAMEHRLRTPDGTAAYARRSTTVEPVFGDLKQNRGWRRFQRRGLRAANSEWALMTLSHNLHKLFEHHTINPGHALT